MTPFVPVHTATTAPIGETHRQELPQTRGRCRRAHALAGARSGTCWCCRADRRRFGAPVPCQPVAADNPAEVAERHRIGLELQSHLPVPRCKGRDDRRLSGASDAQTLAACSPSLASAGCSSAPRVLSLGSSVAVVFAGSPRWTPRGPRASNPSADEQHRCSCREHHRTEPAGKAPARLPGCDLATRGIVTPAGPFSGKRFVVSTLPLTPLAALGHPHIPTGSTGANPGGGHMAAATTTVDSGLSSVARDAPRRRCSPDSRYRTDLRSRSVHRLVRAGAPNAESVRRRARM